MDPINFYREMKKYADEQIRIAREREEILSELGLGIETKADLNEYLLEIGTKAASNKLVEYSMEMHKNTALAIKRNIHVR
jgi:hypothetical protein|tara:strand:+ start:475 stop:714 length:240 start_codon:yes stop_codon:yes gene_type:complete